MQCIPLGSVKLNFPVVVDIALGAQLGPSSRFVCRQGEIEYLTQLNGLHRQWRLDIGGCQGVA